jgi:hypothetical protein
MTDLLIVEAQARRLIYSYARAADRLDRALLATLFWPDAQIELGTIYQGGPEGFLDVCMGFMESMAMTRHDIGNVLAQADGAVEAYVQAWHRIETPEGTRELTVYGRYVTRIEQRGDEWKIASHAELLDFAREAAVDPSWFDGNGEMPKGRRDREDGSYALFA